LQFQFVIPPALSRIGRLAGQNSRRELISRVREALSRAALLLARFLVRCMFSIAPTVLLQLQAVCASGLFLDPIIAIPARCTFKPDIFPHHPTPARARRSVMLMDAGEASHAPRRRLNLVATDCAELYPFGLAAWASPAARSSAPDRSISTSHIARCRDGLFKGPPGLVG
jgi:hypothetical protein